MHDRVSQYEADTDALIAEIFKPPPQIPKLTQMPQVQYPVARPVNLQDVTEAPLLILTECHKEQRNEDHVVEYRGQEMVIPRVDVEAFFFFEQHISRSVNYKELKKTWARGPVSIPSGRRNKQVKGQLKLGLDVALALEHVRKSDEVIVIGSGSEKYGGNSYYLLAGEVTSVVLYDERNLPRIEEINGTVFHWVNENWNEPEVEADVVFMDAYDCENYKVLEFDIKARVYSVKTRDTTVKVPPGSYRYVQPRGVREWRQVSHPRLFKEYRPQLGDCPACVEFDYIADYNMNNFQLDIWRTLHFGGTCVMAIKHRDMKLKYASWVTGVVTENYFVADYTQDIVKREFTPTYDYTTKDERAIVTTTYADLPNVVHRYVDFDIYVGRCLLHTIPCGPSLSMRMFFPQLPKTITAREVTVIPENLRSSPAILLEDGTLVVARKVYAVQMSVKQKDREKNNYFTGFKFVRTEGPVFFSKNIVLTYMTTYVAQFSNWAHLDRHVFNELQL